MRQLVINDEVLNAVVRSKVIDAPTVKTNMVEVEGANGALDLSTVLTEGNPVYESRELEFELAIIGADFFEVQGEFNNLYHGQLLKLTTSDQMGTYYTGRGYLSDWKEERGFISCKLSATVDPFKYEANETVVNVIASEGEGTSATLFNGRKWLAPIVEPSQAIQLIVGSKTYSLQAGAQIIPDLILKSGNTTVKVVGSGTCSFKYRRGWL